MTSSWYHQMCMNWKVNQGSLFDISVWRNRSLKTKLHPMIVRQYSHLHGDSTIRYWVGKKDFLNQSRRGVFECVSKSSHFVYTFDPIISINSNYAYLTAPPLRRLLSYFFAQTRMRLPIFAETGSLCVGAQRPPLFFSSSSSSWKVSQLKIPGSAPV